MIYTEKKYFLPTLIKLKYNIRDLFKNNRTYFLFIFIGQLTENWFLSPSKYYSYVFTYLFQRYFHFTKQFSKASFPTFCNTWDEHFCYYERCQNGVILALMFILRIRKNGREPDLRNREVREKNRPIFNTKLTN